MAGWLRSVRCVAAFLGVMAVAAIGCDRRSSPRAPGPMRIVVTIPPLSGLVRRLAPADAEVTVLISQGRSEHGYELTPTDVASLRGADLVVEIGLGLEPQVDQYLEKHPEPRRRIVRFADAVGLKPEPGAAPEEHTDEHDGDHDEHHHAGADPHLWLDPDLVLKAVPALADAVGGALPAGATRPDPSARTTLEAEIRRLDEECKASLASLAGRSIVTHHAAWSRFAEHFGLKVAAVIRPIEIAEPNGADMEAAVRAIKVQGAGAVFVEPQFNADAARKIAAMAGVRLGTLDPLGDGDWFKLMRDNVESLVRTLGR